MSNESSRPDVGEQSSRWLDEGARASSTPMPRNQDAEKQIADLQLVDAILSNLSDPAAVEKEQRVQRVMSAVDSVDLAPRSRMTRTKVRSVLAIAATLLLAFTLAWTQFNRESHAGGVLRQIAAATAEGIDRIYLLHRHTAHSPDEQRAEGKLFLRGREAFVLACGRDVLGRQGAEYWFVPRQGDVLVAEDFQWMVAESEELAGELELLKQLSEDSARVPIMQLSAIIGLMEHDYHVRLVRDDSPESPEHTIVAELKNPNDTLPQEITLIADAATSIVRRAELSWGPADVLIFELAPDESVPPNWYSPEAHYDDDRAKRRVAREST